VISIVCEAFGCTPDVAEKQDWSLVQAILDYRNAKVPLELMQQGEAGAKAMAAHPDVMNPIGELYRAQDLRAAKNVPPDAGDNNGG